MIIILQTMPWIIFYGLLASTEYTTSNWQYWTWLLSFVLFHILAQVATGIKCVS